MHVLQIEHRVADFDAWKRSAFDADPLNRAMMGVRRHRVARGLDDPNQVMIELEFDGPTEAEAMAAALRRLWRDPLATIGSSTTRIAQIIESKDY